MTMHNPPQAGGIISAMIEDPDIGIRELAAAMAIARFQPDAIIAF